MRLAKLKDMKGGWFIGDFQPSVLQTPHCEVSVKLHPKGEQWDTHYHKVATEVNVLVSGSMTMNTVLLGPGDIFVMEPLDVAAPVFHEDCTIVCVKLPSVKDDKYIVAV
jgi:hypothetical protein